MIQPAAATPSAATMPMRTTRGMRFTEEPVAVVSNGLLVGALRARSHVEAWAFCRRSRPTRSVFRFPNTLLAQDTIVKSLGPEAPAQARRAARRRPTGRRSRSSSSPRPRFRCCWPCRSSAPPFWSPCCWAPISPICCSGSLREMFSTIASALLSEPVALVAFITAFSLVLLGGSVLMFVVKGGTVDGSARRPTPRPARSSANR